MFKTINKRTPLSISFRSWDMYYNPILPQSTSILWNVKLAPENERPRFILLAFRNDDKFKHCNLRDVKVHLNSDSYPYDDLKLKFNQNRYSLLYDMYRKFQTNYYSQEAQPILTLEAFKESPIIVLNVSHQNEAIKTGPID